MTYQELIKSISEIVNNEDIIKEGLTLVYKLPADEHVKMDEHLFYKVNDRTAKFEHQEQIEVELGGVLIHIIKENTKFIYKELVE